MRIDSHLHIWRAIPPELPSPPTTIDGHADVPIELVDDYLSEYGIDGAVLVQPMYPGEDNSYVADAAACRPDRYKAVCVVDPNAVGAADRLAYWVGSRGCRGLRLRPLFAPESAAFGSAESESLWRVARETGIVVNVLCGPQHLDALRSMARRFPEVPIAIDHLGHPRLADGIESEGFQNLLRMRLEPRVHVKLSGYYYFSGMKYPYRDAWDAARAVFDAFGPDRLLWGSDFPHVLLKTGYQRSVEFFARHFEWIGAADRAKILGGNAYRLYWGR